MSFFKGLIKGVLLGAIGLIILFTIYALVLKYVVWLVGAAHA